VFFDLARDIDSTLLAYIRIPNSDLDGLRRFIFVNPRIVSKITANELIAMAKNLYRGGNADDPRR
jgi:hypothetical protein